MTNTSSVRRVLLPLLEASNVLLSVKKNLEILKGEREVGADVMCDRWGVLMTQQRRVSFTTWEEDLELWRSSLSDLLFRTV